MFVESTVSDSPVWRRLNGSSFHVRGPAAAKDRSPKLTFWRWHMADASLRGPQGSPSGNSNQLTLASMVIRRQARQCTKIKTRQFILDPLPNR